MTHQILQTTQGASLVVHDEGQGKLALLISGLGGTAAFWAAQRTALVAAGYRVLSFDQPGCGVAPPWDTEITIDLLARMAAEVLAQSAPGMVPALICGHSTGGAIAQSYLRQRSGPVPARLVLSGTWSRACPYMQALFDYRIRSLDHGADMSEHARLTWLLGVSPEDVETVPPHPPAHHDPVQAEVQRRRMRALLAFDSSAWLPTLTLPVTVLSAADDRIVPPYHQEALARALPDARLVQLPSGGHFFPRSRAEAVNALLING